MLQLLPTTFRACKDRSCKFRMNHSELLHEGLRNFRICDDGRSQGRGRDRGSNTGGRNPQARPPQQQQQPQRQQTQQPQQQTTQQQQQGSQSTQRTTRSMTGDGTSARARPVSDSAPPESSHATMAKPVRVIQNAVPVWVNTADGQRVSTYAILDPCKN